MNDATANGTAIPAIVREWIPDAWMARKPATIEGAWAAMLSLRNAVGIVFLTFYGAADTVGATSSIPMLAAFALHFHWLPIIGSLVLAWLRARVAYVKAKAPP